MDRTEFRETGPRRRLCLLTSLFALILTGAEVSAADAKTNDMDRAYFLAHYTKYEYKIAMRDGIKLFTSVYAPKEGSQSYPILLQRTPYGVRPCHTFRRGHRIMAHVQSLWFPLVDRNPQTFTDIYKAREEDFQKATQRVYRSPDSPSQIRVKILGSAR